MAAKRATVFGGTGFLGRRIAARLAADGAAVRVAVRHPEAAEGEAVRADVRDVESLTAAVAGADWVVNAVGLYLERPGESFAEVHVEGAGRVAEAAARAGAEALVHMSGIGVDAASPSRYVRARAEGEAAVRTAFPAATILRPSVLFGPEDAFTNSLAAIARASPAFPLFGRGETRLAPVFVDDVAAAIAAALDQPEARGETYELGGPKSYSYRDLLQLLFRQIGVKRPLLPIPFVLWEALAAALRPLPRRPVTHDQIVLMKEDNLPAPDRPGFAELGITPQAFEDVLPTYLGAR